jgi:AcrR family transcriptional regulator
MTTVMDTTQKPSARDRMITSARELIQERGVHGVGLRDVVAHAEAARCSTTSPAARTSSSPKP